MLRILVVYDISDDSSRVKVSRVLERWGLARIQRSAFTGILQWPRVRDLSRLLSIYLDEATDILHIIPVPEREWRRTIVLGRQWGDYDVKGAVILQ